MKIGIILVSFGVGLGLGLLGEEKGNREFLIPLSMFVFTGLGFITANIVGKKLDDKDTKIIYGDKSKSETRKRNNSP